MFKFVTPNSATTGQKRKQQARACEPCRRKKRRCEHNAAPESLLSDEHSNGNNQQTLSETQSTPKSLIDQGSHDFSDQSATQARVAHQSDQLQQPSQSTPFMDPPAVSIHVDDGSGLSTDLNHVDALRPRDECRDETLGSRFIGDLSPEGVILAATSPESIGTSSNDTVGVWIAKRLNNRAPDSGSAARNPPSHMSLFQRSASVVQKVLIPLLEQEALSTLPPPANILALSKMYFDKCHPIFPIVNEVGFRSLHPTDPSYILLQQAICLAASRNFTAKEHLILPGKESPLSYREFGDELFASMRLSIEIGLVTDKIVLIQALALMSQFANGPDSGDTSSQFCGRAINHSQFIGLHLKGQDDGNGDRYGTTLLCCLWALDLMNAAFNGRPVLMHERDFGVNIRQCIKRQEPCFRLLLEVTIIFNKVIELYRPSSNPTYLGLEVEFPSFEEMVMQCGASQVDTPLIATIETLYHAVAMLSCRSKSWEDLRRSSPSFLRQTLASMCMSSIVSRELRNQLVLFPFVPYAVSLSLSLAYREMRHSKISIHRARARTQIQTTCGVLSDLGEIFWSASMMAEMGRSILKEMDRVVAAAAGFEERRIPQSVDNGETTENNNHLTRLVPVVENAHGFNGVLSEQPHSFYEPVPNFDSSIFDSISDVDLFGMFDPAFDLNSIDAFLEGNLNLGFPNNFQSMN